MKEKMTITNFDGKEEDVELVNILPIKEKLYILYRPLDDNNDSDEVELSVSRLIEEDGKMQLIEIEDDEEYNEVVNYIESINK